MTVLDRINDQCKALGITRKSIEDKLGFVLSKWNKTEPGAYKLQQVAKELNVTVDYLLTGEVLKIPSSEVVRQIFTPEEQELINLFTAVNAEGQKAILGAVRGIVYTGLYTPKKENQAM